MQQSIGTIIRQLRREQNKTQTALGGTAFSKSYVSAIEGGKLLPSKEALQYFAQILGKPEQYFLAMIDELEPEAPMTQTGVAASLGPEALHTIAHEIKLCLDSLLEQPDAVEGQMPDGSFILQAEILEHLALPDQARYYLFQGLLLQRQEKYTMAVTFLERALAREDHPRYLAAILYELGECYLLLRFPQMALTYAARARQIIALQSSLFTTSSLPFRIELSSGRIALALGWYQQALEHFEQARPYLTARQAMQDAEQLYWGLGYSTYALAHQQGWMKQTLNDRNEQIEHLYQQALGYLVQSYTLAQMAGARQKTNEQRLLLASVQLDLCAWRRWQRGHREIKDTVRTLNLANSASVLDTVNEQCHQVLTDMQLKNAREESRSPGNVLTLPVLVIMIRLHVQRALLARERGHKETYQRERSLASALCQQTLVAYQNRAQLEMVAQNVVNRVINTSFPSLPRFSESFVRLNEPASCPLAELFFVAGEVAEMFGRGADDEKFRQVCYECADTWFCQALEELGKSLTNAPNDAGFLARAYQRYMALVEERLTETESAAGSTIAWSLLDLWKRSLPFMQAPSQSPDQQENRAKSVLTTWQ